MKRIGILMLAVILTGALSFAGFAADAAKANPQAKSARGMVTAVDVAGKSLTIETKRKDKTESMTVTVGDDAKIKVNGKDAKLDDVKAGMRAKVSLSDDGKMAKEVSANDVKKSGEGKKDKGGK